jgi:hypothetical protein
MSINNRGDIRKLIVENKIEFAKAFCDACGWRITQQSIMVKISALNPTEIYDKFQGVLYILTPENETKNSVYNLLVRQIIAKMFLEKYPASGINEKTIINDKFLSEEVPKYLRVVPVSHEFFDNLWSCLKELNIDDDRIGVAWVAAFNLP